jgi:hypothetical protein
VRSRVAATAAPLLSPQRAHGQGCGYGGGRLFHCTSSAAGLSLSMMNASIAIAGFEVRF